ncbi:MAG: MaoC family dehydratase [Alphaproteobacteria bacterium]|nr:MaoC family dehydratase [Alphaproteobacteria bacterium]
MAGYPVAALRDMIGTDVGVSAWVTVGQDMIDRFADLTNDHQFIHVDPVLARQTPAGTTIAHGFLTLSLLGGFVQEIDFGVEGASMGYNYGFDKVRFLAPVPSGSRVRARFRLKDFSLRRPGEWMSTLEATIEIEGAGKPALVAEWLTLTMVPETEPRS